MERRDDPADAEGHEELARALAVLAHPLRVALLNRLGRPAFVPDLSRELGLTRQAITKHLEALEQVGLVVRQNARRGALPAAQFAASPAGLFAFKESVLALAVSTDPAVLPPTRTVRGGGKRAAAPREGAGLLLVHGDVPGRWYPLGGRGTCLVGRDRDADVSLNYDPFASARHATLRRTAAGWTLTDLHSTNGTRVNLKPVPPGETVPVQPGDLLTIGRSHLLFRDGG